MFTPCYDRELHYLMDLANGSNSVSQTAQWNAM